jgi:hypothetical protein
MALITSISNYLSNLRTYTLTQITNIVDAQFRGDTLGTKANKEYHYNNIAGYLQALGWASYSKNTLFVKLDAPVDFNGSDSMIFQTAQKAVDAIPTIGALMPTAINPYVIIGDPLVDFSAVDWTAHIAAGTFPFITTTKNIPNPTYRRLALTSITTLTDAIPAGMRITSIVIFNTTANAVTGGIKIGTTAGGTEVVVAEAVGANALVDATLVKKIFSTTAFTTLYIDAVTAWNNASLNIYIILAPFKL